MNNYLWFMAGFCAGIVPCLTLVFLYYRSALKRVRSIQQAVQNYHDAAQVVHAATRDIYGRDLSLKTAKRQLANTKALVAKALGKRP